MVWYSHLLKNFPQFVGIHTVKDFSVVNETEVDVFLELPCFLHDPMNAGNLISGSSSSSKPSLYTCRFMIGPSWVALHGMAHSFIKLCKPLYHDKAVIHLLDDIESKWIPEKYLLLFTDYTKVFDCVDHNKLENS